MVTFLEDDPIVTTQRTKMLYAGTVTSVAIFLRTVLLLRNYQPVASVDREDISNIPVHLLTVQTASCLVIFTRTVQSDPTGRRSAIVVQWLATMLMLAQKYGGSTT